MGEKKRERRKEEREESRRGKEYYWRLGLVGFSCTLIATCSDFSNVAMLDSFFFFEIESQYISLADLERTM